MSAGLPELDVSIVMFNSARWIAPFLDSLVRQTYPAGRINLLVRDNGSTEEEYQRCFAEIDRRASAFLSVHVDRGDNRGFGHGQNRNFERGRAPLFLVSNVDVEFQREAIVAAVAALGTDGPTVACREFRQQPYEHPKHYHPATLETSWCSSACVLFRRPAFATVGGYEERIFLYGEDVELSFRLRDQGYTLKYCPDAVCVHHTYAAPGVVKPDQFFGSTLANLILRLRYGAPLQILIGIALQLSLWLRWPRFPHYWRRLAVGQVRLARDAAHFLRTRKRSAARFPFRLWGYDLRRDGAFHAAEPLAATPRVSIIVRTHAGRGGFLREALASVANQTYRNIELVVVEDGGESARELVEGAAAGGRFTAVVYYPIAKAGRAAAGNAGLEASTGAVIGFLDDDDLLYADHVETLTAALLAQPELAAVYGIALEIPTTVNSWDPWRYTEHAPALSRRQPFSRALLLQRNLVPIQAVLFRRDCYETQGGFDRRLESHEDWDLWIRYSADRDFRLIPKTTSLYRVPADPVQFLERARTMESSPPPAVAGARTGNTARAPVLGAVAALRILACLPFLRPLFMPVRRFTGWLRECRAVRRREVPH